MRGRSIRIFLVDGNATGLRTAEIGLSTLKAIVVPRASLSAITKRPELQKTGVYVLVGSDSDKPGQMKIYIGEGDTILDRLTAHNKDEGKDFWNEAVVFVSKDENLTKAHVRYLEARMINLAHRAKRATVANGTTPSEDGKLPEADVVEMEEFIEQARLLLGTFGYNLFDSVPVLTSQPKFGKEDNSDALPEFEYSGEHFSATCTVDLDSGQFIVAANSLARKQEARSLRTTYRNLRNQLIDSEVLIETDKHTYHFAQDYTFSAITAAAQVVSGTSVNGRNVWRTKDGTRSFAEWQDSQIESEQQGL